ncbi:outer membrane lipoprotein-sorting protein [Catenovulum agarivorans DS-2]|uniref:Outer membrane lipoprotein-sorting protein n=1 Tax=Catenovulum agarivorans DS-2 TaxID=1328313 RepID=W7QR10_9ALTE|nr:outer membrane lipoprotein-sorting protein [Catenovulum agarivorans]EWH10313.1 outer membrane lipoprotein-sorting protein [Catenovulum agarivorans DS-2]
MLNRNNLKVWLKSVSLVGALWVANSALAESPEEKGLRIATERKAADKGWGDSIATTKMILRNAHGEESVREMRLKALEVNGDGDKGLTIFDRPRDVAGTAFLNHSHINEPDDQWLYLPALKRVKRIASRNKSGPFMGSEFSYEDLASFEVAKYTYKYLRDEVVNGEKCWVLESIPTDRYSGYTKQIVWIDQSHYRPQKVEFYDRKRSLLKTLTMSDYKLYLDKYWRAHTLSMVNHQTGKSTDLLTTETQFRVGLEERDFEQNALRRAR